MDQTIFDTTFPTLCRLLEKTDFDVDKARAAAMSSDEFKAAHRQSHFRLQDLMGLLCRVVAPSWNEPAGDELEANLKSIVDAVGFDQVRRVYRHKLLVPREADLDDVRYEIAVTARACAVLDVGTVQLEKPVPGTEKETGQPKNSDIYGRFGGPEVRIEVTVLHERPIDTVDIDLVKIIENADIARKFSVTMRFAVKEGADARDARAVVELLGEHHLASKGADAEIGGWKFTYETGRYECAQKTSPIESVRFFDEDDPRASRLTSEVRHPVGVQNMTPRRLRDEAPRPAGVFSWSDLPGGPTKEPVSTKIFQMLSGKLAQCEEGIINIVAFGNPRRQNEGDLKAALTGVVTIEVPYEVLPTEDPENDKPGIRLVGLGRAVRDVRAPFNPASRLEKPDDQEQVMGPFRRLSAVWHLRLGGSGLSEMHLNVNASKPLPPELAQQLCGADSPEMSRPTPETPG